MGRVMSTTSAAADTLEVVETPDLTQLDEANSRGLLKGILIAVGVAVIAAAVAATFSRRRD